jgi:iron complex transport system substrate-binding protein
MVQQTTGINDTNGISFVDASGQAVVLPGPPQRIVCLNSDSARVLVAIGSGDKIVGVLESTTKDTELMKRMPSAISIGGIYNQPNIEQVISLRPDVVITLTSSSPALMQRLNQANITVIYLDGYIIEKMPRFIENVALISGSPASADRYLDYYHHYFDLVNSRLADVPPDRFPKVYFEGSSDYSTVGQGSGGDSLIRVAHGKNIAGSITTQWPMVSPEFVVNQDPEVIIKIAYPAMLNNFTISQIREQMIARPGISETRAAKTGQVFVINSYAAYGDQGIITLLYCAKALYPDRFADIDPEQLLYEYSRDFIPGQDNLTAYYPALSI